MKEFNFVKEILSQAFVRPPLHWVDCLAAFQKLISELFQPCLFPFSSANSILLLVFRSSDWHATFHTYHNYQSDKQSILGNTAKNFWSQDIPNIKKVNEVKIGGSGNYRPLAPVRALQTYLHSLTSGRWTEKINTNIIITTKTVSVNELSSIFCAANSIFWPRRRRWLIYTAGFWLSELSTKTGFA